MFNMNILAVTQRYYPVIGGTENLAKSFLDYLSKNHSITVYTTNAKDIQSFWFKDLDKVSGNVQLDYDVVRYDFLTPTDIKFDEKVRNFPFITSYPGPFSPKMWNDLVVKKIDYDLIFVTSFPHDHVIPAYVASKKWKIPLIIMPLIHQEFPELYLNSIKLTMLNNSQAVFVISESEKKILTKNGIDEGKMTVIHPFVHEVSQSPKTSFRKKYNIENKKIILFIGSRSFVKGITYLLEVLKQIWKENSDSVLVVVGPSTEKYEEAYSKLPEHIRKRIIDFGIVDEEIKKNVLSECEMLVLPSKSESFGLVFLEAWMHEKPVIGCNLAPVSELVEHKKNGLLVEFGNIEQLKKAILYLLNNPDVSSKFGKNGKNKALKLNSKENLEIFEKKCLSIIEKSKIRDAN